MNHFVLHNKVFFSILLLLSMACISPYAFANTEQEGDTYLDMDLQQLMEIIITSAAKKPQKVKDTPAAAFVITQDDIRKSGVTTVADALAMAPGLYVAKISNSRWSISSRGFPGFTSNKLLILIDGKSVYMPTYSGTFWEEQLVMLEDVDRIEIIRGPGGTLWGANAVNGVINIITKKAKDTQGNLVRAGAGTEEKAMAAGRAGMKFGDSTYGRLFISYNNHDSNSTSQPASNAGLSNASDGWSSGQLGGRIDGAIDSKKSWTIQGDIYKIDGDQLTYPLWKEGVPYPGTEVQPLDLSGGSILTRWEQEFQQNEKFSAQFYFFNRNRSEEFYEQTLSTFDIDLQYDFPLTPRNNVTLGAGIRWDIADFDQTFMMALKDTTDTLYSVFIEDEITLFPNTLWLTIGTKYEHNDYTGCEWQPSGKLLYIPAIDHSVWLSVSRAVRTPSFLENSGTLTLGVYPGENDRIQTAQIKGDSNFGSEEVIAYEAGYRWKIFSNMSLDLAAFYNDYDDIYNIHPIPTNDGMDLKLSNAIKGHNYGFELAMDWNPIQSWRLDLAYSYIKQHFKNKTDDQYLYRGNYLEKATPSHQVSLRSSYNLTDSIMVNLWFRYIDSVSSAIVSSNTADAKVDNFCILDANIIWNVTEQLEVVVAGQNLLNDSQLQYKAEFFNAPTEIDRGAYIKLTYHF